MRYLILRTATRFLFPLFILFSIFLLLVGHNEPGGGFVGGLAAAAAFALYAIAYDVASARSVLRVDPRTLIGSGLCASAFSGLIGVMAGKPFFTGRWVELDLPGIGHLKLGSPMLFDIGVYLVVVGIALHIIFTLAEDV